MRLKPLLIILAALATAGLVGYLLYNQLSFFIVSTFPKDNASTSASQVIQFKFNKDLDSASAQGFTLSPQVGGKITVSGRILAFTPDDPLKLNTDYMATLKSPRSSSGAVTKDVVIHFNTTYIPDSQLDPLSQRNAKSRTDKIEDSNPLLQSLPQENLDYKISYSVNSDQSVTYTITLYATQNRPDQFDRYMAQLKQYKQEALDFIRSKGEDPTKLTIQYDPPDAKDL